MNNATAILEQWLRPDKYRFRAEEARTLAGDMKGEETRAMMLRVAADYDKLAVQIEGIRH